MDDSLDNEEIHARWDDLTSVPWHCAKCGQLNTTLLDLGGGFHQSYTEDCQVCCRPNVLRVDVDDGTMIVSISNELEYE